MVQKVVLAIDDDPVTLSQYRDVLGDRYNVRFALNGEQATEIIDQTPPELIIVDVRMPGESGPRVVRKLRRYTPVPVMMISVYPQDVSEDELINLQIHAALIKPVAADALLFEVESLLKSHNLQTNEAL
jgi:DNA-binding response OmpR family regulator